MIAVYCIIVEAKYVLDNLSVRKIRCEVHPLAPYCTRSYQSVPEYEKDENLVV